MAKVDDNTKSVSKTFHHDLLNDLQEINQEAPEYRERMLRILGRLWGIEVLVYPEANDVDITARGITTRSSPPISAALYDELMPKIESAFALADALNTAEYGVEQGSCMADITPRVVSRTISESLWECRQSLLSAAEEDS